MSLSTLRNRLAGRSLVLNERIFPESGTKESWDTKAIFCQIMKNLHKISSRFANFSQMNLPLKYTFISLKGACLRRIALWFRSWLWIIIISLRALRNMAACFDATSISKMQGFLESLRPHAWVGINIYALNSTLILSVAMTILFLRIWILAKNMGS